MREKGQTEVAKTLETPVFSRGIEILTEKSEFVTKRSKFIELFFLRILSIVAFLIPPALGMFFVFVSDGEGYFLAIMIGFAVSICVTEMFIQESPNRVSLSTRITSATHELLCSEARREGFKSQLKQYKYSHDGAKSIATKECEEDAVRKAQSDNDGKKSMGKSLNSSTSIGDIITFGSYWKDSKDYKQPIEWLVLDKGNGKALLISKFVLELNCYGVMNNAWETSSIRRKINGDFLNEAFSADEQKQIVNTRIFVDFQRDPSEGKPTYDKIFLLSPRDVSNYFSDDNDRRCMPTNYVKSQFHQGWSGFIGWWLLPSDKRVFERSYPPFNQDVASYRPAVCRVFGTFSPLVTDQGKVGSGHDIEDSSVGVRPALWVKLG